MKNTRRYRPQPQSQTFLQSPLRPPPPWQQVVPLIRPDQAWPKQAPIEFEYDGGTPSAGAAHIRAQVVLGARDRAGNSVGAWRIGWDGRMVTFGSATTVVGEWRRRSGGVLPECLGEGSGPARIDTGSDQVAEIAAVATAVHVFRLLLLNERAQRLASLQVLGFDEPRLMEFADAAGLHYRRYRLADQSPSGLETYFPPRYRDAVVFSLSETCHVVRREGWIQGSVRIQPDF